MAAVGHGARARASEDHLDPLSVVDALPRATRPLPDEAGSLIGDLLSLSRGLVESAHDLMLARNLVDLLDRGADTAIQEAAESRGDEAIDRAVSSVGAAAEARDNEIRAFQRWVRRLDRVDEVTVAARRFVDTLT